MMIHNIVAHRQFSSVNISVPSDQHHISDIAIY